MSEPHGALLPAEDETPTMVGELASYLGVVSPALGLSAFLFSVIGLPASFCCGVIPLLGLGLGTLAGASSVMGITLGYLAIDDQRLSERRRDAARRDLQRSWVGLALGVLASMIQCTPVCLAMVGWALMQTGI